jgi:catechol 2,3-dioxygenase-like lactoylglutathione lyase family enzyme
MTWAKAIHPTIAVKDLERAKSWYADKLGLKPMDESEAGAYYQVGDTVFLLFPTQFAGTAQNTVMEFEVDDVKRSMAELRKNGVVFEEYDLPGLKTVDGVAKIGEFEGGWFKDSEGNILAIGKAGFKRS